MEAKLVIIGGKANKKEVALRLPTIVGRSREAGLTIAHPMVSRQHCELYEESGLLMIRDLGSLNGTYVARERIAAPSAIYPKQEFTVGPLTFRAEYAYSGEIATAPPVAPSPPAEPALVEPRSGLPGIAPPPASLTEPAADDGQFDLPDFAAWAQADNGEVAEPGPAAAEPASASPSMPPESPARAGGWPMAPADDEPVLPSFPEPQADAGAPSPDADGDFSFGAPDADLPGSNGQAAGPAPLESELEDERPTEAQPPSPPVADEPEIEFAEPPAGDYGDFDLAPPEQIPASASGKKSRKPDEDEDLDDFFKDVL